MKFNLSWLTLLSIIMFTSTLPVSAQDIIPAEEPFSGAVVCAPDAYLLEPGDCLPLGPSVYLTSLARLGLTLPERPLPAYRPDPELTQIPYRYFHMADDMAPKFYSTLPDAQAKSDNALTYAPGFVYISYQNTDPTGHFFLTQSGYWIRGDGYRIQEYSSFQGLQFKKTPRNAFGWTFEQIPVKSAPGYGAADTGENCNPGQLCRFTTRRSSKTPPGI